MRGLRWYNIYLIWKIYTNDSLQTIFINSYQSRIDTNNALLWLLLTFRFSKLKESLWNISQNAKQTTYDKAQFFQKKQSQTWNLTKNTTPLQLLSCEFCKFFKTPFWKSTIHVFWTLKILMLTRLSLNLFYLLNGCL